MKPDPGMKGQHSITSYVFSILISVILVVALTLFLFNFYRQTSDAEAKRQLSIISSQAVSEMTNLYSSSKLSSASPGNYTSVELGRTQLELPERVAGKSYEIYLVQENQLSTIISSITISDINVSAIVSDKAPKLVARTRGDNPIEVQTQLPITGVDLQGKIENGNNATVTYIRRNVNGTIIDLITLGDPQILVKVDSIGVS